MNRLNQPYSTFIQSFVASQFVKIGEPPVQFFASARHCLEKVDDGPEGGLPLGVTSLFPKG